MSNRESDSILMTFAAGLPLFDGGVAQMCGCEPGGRWCSEVGGGGPTG